MSPPRLIEKGQTAFVTCGAIGRSFRFLPTAAVVQLLWFVFALAAKVRGIDVHEVLFMSNHFHVLLTDVKGELPEFMRDMNSLISRGLNALRGETGSNIEKGYNAVVPADDEKVMEHAVYTLLNPCKANLVELAREWAGVSSLALEYSQSITLKRPQAGLWKPFVAGAAEEMKRLMGNSKGRRRRARRTRTPASVEFALVRPPVHPELSDQALRALIRERVGVGERECSVERKKYKVRVLGMARVKTQSWSDTPSTTRVLFNTTPRVSGKSRRTRVAAIGRLMEFELAYAEARDKLTALLRAACEAGKSVAKRLSEIARLGEVVFPHGSYLLCRRYGLRCQPPP